MSKGLEAYKLFLDDIEQCVQSGGIHYIDRKNRDIIEKELKALEIIKVLFQGRVRLYERNDGIEQVIDKNGNYRKCSCVVYILEFYSGRIHYEFHLHKDEFDLLKEVML